MQRLICRRSELPQANVRHYSGCRVRLSLPLPCPLRPIDGHYTYARQPLDTHLRIRPTLVPGLDAPWNVVRIPR